MHLPKALTLFNLASTALASGATILSAMSTITNTTKSLNKTISSWDGRLLGIAPISVKSAQLLLDIVNGTSIANASSPLTFAEAAQVASATTELAAVVNGTLDTIVQAKPKFDKLLLTPVILIDLQLQRDASEDFAATVVDKVPASLRDTAEGLVEPIDEAFGRAVGKFSGRYYLVST